MLNLQGDLDTVDASVQATRAALAQNSSPKKSLELLSALQESQDALKDQVEVLYASLNIHESFAELEGVNLEFVQVLLMARDLKINIRKRSIGSFFEWDKLDQAVGGRDETIGKIICSAARTLSY